MIISSTYRPPLFLRNGHANTIYAALMRQVQGVLYDRERLLTPDKDFLDLDWSSVGSKNLLVALHGLEGASNRPYIKGIIKYFNNRGWDGVGMNFRGCSGETNWQLRSYHMGETEDLGLVLEHILSNYTYENIVLAGFSLGGNVVLKYMGESAKIPREVKAGIAFSVPCNLSKANFEIDRPKNYMYRKRFLNSLNRKYGEKAKVFPDIPAMNYPARNFMEFDSSFTAPVHGFESADQYWRSTSSINFLNRINIPAYMLSSRDDSFLSEECYPYLQAETNDKFRLEVSDYGGHVGFVDRNEEGSYYSEQRAWAFVQEVIK